MSIDAPLKLLKKISLFLMGLTEANYTQIYLLEFGRTAFTLNNHGIANMTLTVVVELGECGSGHLPSLNQ